MRRTTEGNSDPNGVATIGESENRIEIHDPSVTASSTLNWAVFAQLNGETVADVRIMDSQIPVDTASDAADLLNRLGETMEVVENAVGAFENGNTGAVLANVAKLVSEAKSLRNNAVYGDL